MRRMGYDAVLKVIQKHCCMGKPYQGRVGKWRSYDAICGGTVRVK